MLLVAFKSLGAFLAVAATPKEIPFEVVDSSYGSNSSVTAPNVALASTSAAWAQMWAAHTGTRGAPLPPNIKLANERPEVDFTRVFVVGIFGGTTAEIEGYEVVDAKVVGKEAIVRFQVIPMPNPGPAQRISQPFGFVVLPLTKEKVVVQLPDGRDGWRTVATFDSPIPAKKKG